MVLSSVSALTWHQLIHDFADDFVNLLLRKICAADPILCSAFTDQRVRGRIDQIDDQRSLGVLANRCVVGGPG
jgi:hypothetical protein